MCHLSIGSNSSTNSREKMALIAAVDRLFLLWPFHWNRIQFSLFSVLFSSFLFRILVQHSLVVILFDLLIPLVINVRMHAKCINFIFLASHKSIWIENGVFLSSFAIFSTILAAHFSMPIGSQAVVHRARLYSLLFMWFVAVSMICVCTFVSVAKWEWHGKMHRERERSREQQQENVRGVEDKRNKLHWSAVHFLLVLFFFWLVPQINFRFLWTFFFAALVFNRPWTKRSTEKFGARTSVIYRVDIDFAFHFVSYIIQLIWSCYLFYFSGFHLAVDFVVAIVSQCHEQSAHSKTKFLNFLFTSEQDFFFVKQKMISKTTRHRIRRIVRWNSIENNQSHAEMRILASQDNAKIIFPIFSTNGVPCPGSCSGLRSISLSNGNRICYFLRCAVIRIWIRSDLRSCENVNFWFSSISFQRIKYGK